MKGRERRVQKTGKSLDCFIRSIYESWNLHRDLAARRLDQEAIPNSFLLSPKFCLITSAHCLDPNTGGVFLRPHW